MKLGATKVILVSASREAVRDELKQYGLALDESVFISYVMPGDEAAILALAGDTPWCVVGDGVSPGRLNFMTAHFGAAKRIPDAINLLNDNVVPPAYQNRNRAGRLL